MTVVKHNYVTVQSLFIIIIFTYEEKKDIYVYKFDFYNVLDKVNKIIS